MNFDFTDEQSEIKRLAREFAESEIAPHVLEWDETQMFPMDVFKKLAGLGFLGVLIPTEYHGAGLGYVEYVSIIEEISRVDGAIGLSVAAHNSLCSNHIFIFGTAEQKGKYLPRLATGEWLGAWGLTEPEAGSDASGTQTTAVRDGDSYVLNGSKTFTTHGTYGDVFVLMAVTDRAKDNRGISAFIVEKGTPGLRGGKKENKLGCRASDTSEVILDHCRIPAANLLGAEGEGFINCLEVLDGGRISIAALAVGMAQGAFEAALKYAKQRRQFGQPIAEFQAIQWKLADMATEIEAARLLTYRAGVLKNQKKRSTKESSMAKLYASEVSVRVANEAIQIHGGYGYVKEYPVEKFYRDSKICTIGEGTSEIQRLVIARQLLRSQI
ncbi:MAG: acyl-CoA dehydrogenase [Acidobacteria bacterium]|nr:acyl-CoA dehydrogenase [Acidobacteriota bacterium]